MATPHRGMAPGGAGWNATTIGGRLPAFGMALLRVGFGLVFLANGVAKLGDQPNRIPPFKGFLITRDGARSILDADTSGHPVAAYRSLVEFILDRWGFFGAILTATELAVGIALILGILTPLAALVGAGLILHLEFANIYRGDKWLFEAFVMWIPLLALACLRAGRAWGVDTWLARRLPQWPFT